MPFFGPKSLFFFLFFVAIFFLIVVGIRMERQPNWTC